MRAKNPMTAKDPAALYASIGLCYETGLPFASCTCEKHSPDNAMLRARAEGLVAQLNQDLEPWEMAAIDAELAEIGNSLQRDGEAISDEADRQAEAHLTRYGY